MLNSLTIKNFAIVKQLELKFGPNLNVITGETGAGKSIIIDAISLVLGARASSNLIRPNCDKAEIALEFDISNNSNLEAWFKQHDLESDLSSCHLRRIITADAKTRCYINGNPVPLYLLKELGRKLISIHSQHQNLDILSRNHQLIALDNFAANIKNLNAVKAAFKAWETTKVELDDLQQQQQAQQSKAELLQYQVQELAELNPQPLEWEELQQQHKQLSNAEHIINVCDNIYDLISGDADITIESQLYSCQKLLASLPADLNLNLNNLTELLNQAEISLTEFKQEIRAFAADTSVAPDELDQIEAKLSKYHELARKHKIEPALLAEHFQSLSAELDNIDTTNAAIEQLQQQLAQSSAAYMQAADQLSAARQKAAPKFAAAICQAIKTLGMEHAKLEFKFAKNTNNLYSSSGYDVITTLISTNPGQAASPLEEIASGGEVSRISLAIQALTVNPEQQQSLIFDEVDVGIGGRTATMVGKMLHTLAQHTQVFCITHLAQVAAFGQQHFVVEKVSTKQETQTKLVQLDAEARVKEIARMLGGDHSSKQALEHAKEFLAVI